MFFYYVLIFVLGSAFGSFLNVVVDRSIRGQSIMGRSYCDWCRAKLSTIDLIPIASFVALGARCRRCKRPLSWQYPIVESLTGILFVLTFFSIVNFGQFSLITLIYYLFLICVMVVVGVMDLKFYLIPTAFVFAASLISLFYNYFFLSSYFFIDHVVAAFGAAIFFALIVLVTLGRGMGEGDIFLGFLIGMVLGIEQTILALFSAFTVGAIVALSLVVLGKKKFGQAVPFGPFLIFGFFISLFLGNVLREWYLMLY